MRETAMTQGVRPQNEQELIDVMINRAPTTTDTKIITTPLNLGKGDQK